MGALFSDFYEMLGIDSMASEGRIRVAINDAEAQGDLQEKVAFVMRATLLDAEKRAEYDRRLQQARRRQQTTALQPMETDAENTKKPNSDLAQGIETKSLFVLLGWRLLRLAVLLTVALIVVASMVVYMGGDPVEIARVARLKVSSEQRRSLDENSSGLRLFSPDIYRSEMLAGELALQSLGEAHLIKPWQGYANGGNHIPMASTPDGKTIVALGQKSQIYVFGSVQNGMPLLKVLWDGKSEIQPAVIAVSDDGRYVAVGVGEEGGYPSHDRFLEQRWGVPPESDEQKAERAKREGSHFYINLWDIRKGQKIQEWAALNGRGKGLLHWPLSAAGNRLFVNGRDAKLIDAQLKGKTWLEELQAGRASVLGHASFAGFARAAGNGAIFSSARPYGKPFANPRAEPQPWVLSVLHVKEPRNGIMGGSPAVVEASGERNTLSIDVNGKSGPIALSINNEGDLAAAVFDGVLHVYTLPVPGKPETVFAETDAVQLPRPEKESHMVALSIVDNRIWLLDVSYPGGGWYYSWGPGEMTMKRHELACAQAVRFLENGYLASMDCNSHTLRLTSLRQAARGETFLLEQPFDLK